ncbi:hypothetical protein [Actinomyces culturomici]|uniref:hypothetical protein n=1 Tax=Actinomyces culturomici TaxID=1926276 RepID=UPI000E202689|nr:hypothetical protein [Actinomyces culturomici]
MTGAELADVLETIRRIGARGRTWMELTTLLIPGHNDSEEMLRGEAEWILGELGPDVPLHLTAFHPAHRLLDAPPTPAATLTRAREIALEVGLHHVYTGNVRDPAGSTTRCTACGTALIRRDWFEVSDYRLTSSGACPTCGSALAGRFGTGAGGASARPYPVRL